MRVLDLDLDFFLDRVHTCVHDEDRLSDAKYHPWDEGEVRAFLEGPCRLSRSRPTPGRFVRLHHEAFFYFRELVSQGRLTAPFDVAHVDAHADLGKGDGGWAYVLGDLVHRDVSGRQDPRVSDGSLADDGMGEGNYLLFALACRWVSRLTYVTHPHAVDDLLRLVFPGRDPGSGLLRLSRVPPDHLDAFMTGNDKVVVGHEPAIPFLSIPGEAYQADAPFDFLVLSHSPAYTPPAADTLIPVILGYVAQE